MRHPNKLLAFSQFLSYSVSVYVLPFDVHQPPACRALRSIMYPLEKVMPGQGRLKVPHLGLHAAPICGRI